jgi:hypothetical protein
VKNGAEGNPARGKVIGSGYGENYGKIPTTSGPRETSPNSPKDSISKPVVIETVNQLEVFRTTGIKNLEFYSKRDDTSQHSQALQLHSKLFLEKLGTQT